jgi:hypothetical protein
MKTTPKLYDFLEKCTKAEIIHFIRTTSTMRELFTYKQILFYRWQKQDDICQKMLSDNILRGEKINMKERDKLIEQCNAEPDRKKKLEILKQMEPYDKKFRVYMAECKKEQKEREKADKLYEEYSVCPRTPAKGFLD